MLMRMFLAVFPGRSGVLLLSLFAAFSVSSLRMSWAQAPVSPVPPLESVQDLVSRLTPEQKQQWQDAMQAFNTKHYADALARYKQLLTQLPEDAILSKFAGESSLNLGDPRFALDVLKPWASAHPEDWQATALLTRACAESGETNCRDAGMAHLLELHRQGITPPRMQQYILEQIKEGDNTLIIRTSLEPWGPYKVYDLGQVLNKEGKIFLRITLESSDADQGQFVGNSSNDRLITKGQFQKQLGISLRCLMDLKLLRKRPVRRQRIAGINAQ
jgi:hypothetical protein